MMRPEIVCIQRTCPGCGARNRVMTPEVRPAWTIHCSSCGTVLTESHGFRPRLVRPVRGDGESISQPGSAC